MVAMISSRRSIIGSLSVLFSLFALSEAGAQSYVDIGFDDLPATSYTRPKLNTVRVPAHDMGRRAAEILIASIERHIPVQSVELQTELIVRETTAPPGSRVF